ncbi:histidine-containing phosphotransfer protein 4-like [Quercus robur]|uniref:histidine-containing phosphotransfer protein 4-like n=1 Tax=Quercus robur TaxID=38942 RepID=UPI002163F64D|nr:histidine-containing phosphotransfer protein 4-like [Quercus robur]
MESDLLREQISNMRQSLFVEEILEYQFLQLEQLQDNENPNFLQEIMTLYFRESPKTIAIIDQALEEHFNFPGLYKYLHQLKGSSASIGANKVTKEINQALECFKEGDIQGCKGAVQRLKQEHNILRNRLQSYFQLLRQIKIC